MKLNISESLSLPSEAALWTFADLAIKGAGKTYVASVLAEELIKSGVPIMAIDSMGIWWGLGVGVNGHKGLPVVVFGGKHKHLPIPTKIDKARPIVDEERLKLMVKAILESRMNAIIDTSEFSKGMRRRIVAILTSELYNLNSDYGVRHVFLEEADEWIPQRLHGKDEWASACFGAIDDLVRKGGNYLLGCTMITQRSAVLSKDVLSQINCLIVLRILHKGDKEAVQGWVESVANPHDKRIAKWYDSLKDLENGEAWIWNPQANIFDKIQFRKRETLHATREYFMQAKFDQKNIQMMDVAEFISKFKNVFEPKPKEEKKLEAVAKATRKEIPRPLVLNPPHLQTKPIIPQPRIAELPNQTEPIQVAQSLPNVEIQQLKPTLNISVELLEQPTTPLGKAIVVLKNDALAGGRQDKWTGNRIKEHVRRHSWDDSGVDEAIDQLIRWEILTKNAAKCLRFYPSRVNIKESSPMLEAQ